MTVFGQYIKKKRLSVTDNQSSIVNLKSNTMKNTMQIYRLYDM